MVATDGGSGNANSGVKNVEVLIGPSGGALTSQRDAGGYVESNCNESGCPNRLELDWDLNPDRFPDGDYTVKIVTRDQVAGSAGAPDSRHVTSTQLPVTIDRRGDIYNVSSTDGDPAAGGEVDSNEWGRYGTLIGREEDSDFLTTRTVVPCDDAQPQGPQCAEERERPKDDYGDLAPDISTTRSNDPDDASKVPIVSEILSHATEPLPFPAQARGSLASVMEPWQTAPPNHGSDYVRFDEDRTETRSVETPDSSDPEDPSYDEVEVTVHVQYYFDEATRLPIRQHGVDENGNEDDTYYTYKRDRLTVEEVPGDFFRVARPLTAEAEDSTEYTGAEPVGPTVDSDTGQTYQPLFLGTSAPLPDVSACLASGVRFEVFDPWNVVDSDDLVSEHDLSKVTQVHAEYNLLGADQECVPGIGAMSLPGLEVLSFQRDSAVAAMLREAFMSRVAQIAADPTDPDFDRSGVVAVPLGTRIVTAYVVPLEDGDGMTAFVDMSPDVTVQISGPITKEEIDDIVSQLQAF